MSYKENLAASLATHLTEKNETSAYFAFNVEGHTVLIDEDALRELIQKFLNNLP